MAVFRVNRSFLINEDYNSIREYSVAHRFRNNVYRKDKGFVFEDILAFYNVTPTTGIFKIEFGGESIAYKRGRSGYPIISGGYFTGYKELRRSGLSWVEVLSVVGFKLPAKKFYKALMSSSADDDKKIGGQMLKGNDLFIGSNRRDIFSAGSGDDKAYGKGGGDTLAGGPGKDSIFGGPGADRLTGERGKDRFIYRKIKDSRLGSRHRDVITDFNGEKGDRIDLRRIDGSPKEKGNQKLRFIGSKPFSGRAGEARFAGGILQVDTDMNGKPDMEIGLAGVNAFNQNFLIL